MSCGNIQQNPREKQFIFKRILQCQVLVSFLLFGKPLITFLLFSLKKHFVFTGLESYLYVHTL
jgi:hypothetical protein